MISFAHLRPGRAEPRSTQRRENMDDDGFNYDIGDLDELVLRLRRQNSPEIRARAAAILGRLGELAAVDPLVKAVYLDPEPAVQKAARQALREILGDQAEMAIRMGADADAGEEDWLLGVDPDQEHFFSQERLEDKAGPSEAERRNMEGLIFIANHAETNQATRLKAIRALAEVDDMHVFQTLAGLVLWEDDPQIKTAAHRVLEEKFGEDLEDFLESFHDESAAETFEQNDEPEPAPVYNSAAPVMQEEKSSGLFIILAVLLVIVLAAIILLR